MTDVDAATALVIRARRVFSDVAADPRRFVPIARQLAAQAERARVPEALVLALRAEAWADRAALAPVTALARLDRAARIARRHGLAGVLAEVLISRAAVHQELGRPAAARRDLAAAAPSATGAAAGELAFQQAVLHQNSGDAGAAAAAYRRLLAQPDLAPRAAAIAANNLAIIEAEQTRFGAALRLLDDAGRRAGGVGPAVVALVAQSRAWVTVRSGRLADGIRLFGAAATAYGTAGLPLGEHYVEYADALMDLRLLPEATSAARAAAAEFEQRSVALLAAEAQLRVAQLELLSGDPAAAHATATTAAAGFARQRRPTWRARAQLVAIEATLDRAGDGSPPADLLLLARRAARVLAADGTLASAVEAHLLLGRVAARLAAPPDGTGSAGSSGQPGALPSRHRRDAVGALRRAAALAAGAPVLVRLRGATAAATADRLVGDDAAALDRCRRGLRDLARHRAALPSAQLRALASGHGIELGRLGLSVVLRDGTPTRVLDWMERTRAAAMLTVQPVRVPRLRALLAGRVLVEYGVLGGSVVAVVVEPRHSRVVALGPVAPVVEQVEMLHFALRRMCQDRPPHLLAAARASAERRRSVLHDLLLAPLRVDPCAELVVVPAGPLHAVPWPALWPAAVALAPSATFWARTAAQATAHAAQAAAQAAAQHPAQATTQDPGPTRLGTLLVAGPSLPGAVAEVEELRSVHPDAVALLPPRSTTDEVARRLDGVGLAHFACHGRLRADNPMYSSLVLVDGPLTVQELDHRAARPHRLVLASCESGADVSYAGDEVLGFVSALLAAGTGGVVASTTLVPDLRAVPLMRALHTRIAAGDTMARALHHARAGIDRADPASYVTWCTFAAHGAA